jgi:hypothetical protein
MLSHRHVGAPLYHYTSQVGPRFWTFGSLVEGNGNGKGNGNGNGNGNGK